MRKERIFVLLFWVVFGWQLSFTSVEADVNIDSNNTSGIVGITQTGGWTSVADKFVADVTGSITSIDACVYDNGSIANNVDLSIQGDSAGAPDGVAVGSGAIPVGSITSTHQKVASNSMSVPIVSGTTYWVVMSSLDVNQESAACGDTGGSTMLRYLGGTSWSGAGGTLSATVHTSAGGGSGTTTQQTFSTTTEVTDTPTDDVFHGFVLFFVAFGFTVWLLKRKK